jgi:hypothetical protein
MPSSRAVLLAIYGSYLARRARHENPMINVPVESPLRGEAAGIRPVTASSADVRG